MNADLKQGEWLKVVCHVMTDGWPISCAPARSTCVRAFCQLHQKPVPEACSASPSRAFHQITLSSRAEEEAEDKSRCSWLLLPRLSTWTLQRKALSHLSSPTSSLNKQMSQKESTPGPLCLSCTCRRRSRRPGGSSRSRSGGKGPGEIGLGRNGGWVRKRCDV